MIKELSDKDKAAIRNVFKRHKIAITEEYLGFQWLIARIEHSWVMWEGLRWGEKKSRIGRADMLTQIKHLLHALKKLNPSTREALGACLLATPTLSQIEKTRLLSPFMEKFMEDFDQRADEKILTSESDIAFELIIESCEEALKRGGPSMIGGLNAVDDSTTKAGRPPNGADIYLVHDLRGAYQMVTHKNASETPHGPFDDFLSAVFKIIDPHRDPQGKCNDFRKLIRAAKGKRS